MAADWYRLSPGRPAAFALRGMVASSQWAATRAGQRVFERGGNAVDAALAAAAVLAVTEPMSTGVGGDLFALVHGGGEQVGLDAAGPAPRAVEDPSRIASEGPESVTVPGAVAGWASLAGRFGRLGLDACLADAIELAEGGFALGEHASRMWREAPRVPDGFAASPKPGDRVRIPELASTLRAIGREGPEAFYLGPVAEAIVGCSWLAEEDLAGYAPRWVTPLEVPFGGLRVLELPPPTQGIAALEALALVGQTGTGMREQLLAVQLSLEDAFAHVRDGADVAFLLSEDRLRRRALERPAPVGHLEGGTVYVCAVDEDLTAVSLIQSIYGHFGSGLCAPGTGVVLNNRVGCFSVNGRVEPGRRPYHTLIPGMLTRPDGTLIGPFGVMGGLIQAQAHLQFVVAALEEGMDPQRALDRSRFRLEGARVHLEPGLWDAGGVVAELGLEPVQSREVSIFGGGQAIFVRDGHLVGGSDSRKDGHAGGY